MVPEKRVSPVPGTVPGWAEHPGSSVSPHPLGTSPWISNWKQCLALKSTFLAVGIDKRRTGG